MTDRYGKIRQALAMGPTPASLAQNVDEDAAYAMFCCRSAAEAAFVTACDPDTICDLLAERDQLAAENERLLAERDALARDAARYRWLREGGLFRLPYEDHGLGPEFPCCEELDAAIDEAMTKEDSND